MSLDDFAKGVDDVRLSDAILEMGRNKIIDDEGLDWWEILSLLVHAEIQKLLLVSRLADHLKSASMIVASGRDQSMQALGILLGMEVKSFPRGKRDDVWRRVRHYTRLAWNLEAAQILEIALDKWDPGYGVRRRLHSRREHSADRPLVLLPSGYVNVSRTAIEYADMLPQRQFLLVTTRRSGRLVRCPPNVMMSSLASYASGTASTALESRRLANEWQRFKEDVIGSSRELTLADKVGIFDDFPALLRNGLTVRDAWRQVFHREPIGTVLCGDDSNPYTRIPVILAAGRGVTTICYHHGALDVRMLLKEMYADVYLAKGEMEKDYLLRICGVLPERIVLGAACRANKPIEKKPESQTFQPSVIAFFSEPYEITSGRTEEFYKDVLPGLCRVARNAGKKVVVKLHPFESRRERLALVERILAEDRGLVDVIDTPLSAEFLSNVWFALTVESSVAVECTLQNVPCFLCGWLEADNYGYLEQYAKFGAGYVLSSPEEIEHIEEFFSKNQITPDVQQKLWQPITAVELDRLLSNPPSPYRMVQPYLNPIAAR